MRIPHRDGNGNKQPLLFVVVASMSFVSWVFLRTHDDGVDMPITMVDRAEFELGKSTPPSELFFDQATVTSEGDFVVGLFQARNWPKGTFFPAGPAVPAPTMIVAIAINSNSGEIHALNIYPPRGATKERYEVFNIDSLGPAMCVFELIPYAHDDHDFDWDVPGALTLKWNLQSGQLSQLTKGLVPFPVAQLSRVLEPTSFRVKWPQFKASPWDGMVEIIDRSADGGSNSPLLRLNLAGQRDERRSGETQIERLQQLEIAPGHDERTIIGIRLDGEMDAGHVIEAFDLRSPVRINWRTSSETISRDLNIASSKIELIDGLCGPCTHIPLQVGTHITSESWLCDLNPTDGTIRKVKRFEKWAWGFELACSTDGRYVAHCYRSPSGEGQLRILDIANRKDEIVMPIDYRNVYHDDTSFWPDYSPLIRPLGFNRDRSLILCDSKNVFLLKYPYDGKWECLLSVARIRNGSFSQTASIFGDVQRRRP